MHQTPPKRRQLIQRTIVYSLMTTFVFVFVAILVFLMLGYRFNQTSNKIEQGGLVQFSSHPNNARVTIGQAAIVDTTPSKITVNPGDYTAKMEKDNYRTWQKDVTVRAGEILWLNYAQLVPNELTTKTVTALPKLAQAVASPDGQYIATITDKSTQSLSVIEIDNETTKQTAIKLSADLVTANTAGTYSIVRWSNDGDMLLVKHVTKSGTEWLVIDRANPEDSYNITSTYDVALTDAEFDPRSHDRLFIRTTSGDVRLLNGTQESLSAVLVKDVSYMSLLDNRALMYVQNATKKESIVGYVTLGETKGRELTRILGTETVRVGAGRYFSDFHVAITVGDTLTVYKLDNLPNSNLTDTVAMTALSTIQLPGKATFLSVRSGGRFAVAQSARGFTTYDIELKKYVVTNVATALGSELRWLDYYHPYYMLKDQLQVLEFDGANRNTIATASSAFDAVQSDNGKYIYSFVATKTGYALQRTQMILE